MQNPHILTWPGGSLSLDRVRVMGVLNVTPDSFSDGGKYLGPEAAVARAMKIAEEGADILDIGAESTRPGAEVVSSEEERKRLWPVLETLAGKNFPLPISLDSRKPEIVREALSKKWVQIVNDVEGFRNPDMVKTVKEFNVPAILMHMWGEPRTMQQDYAYEDVVTDIIAFFKKRISETGLTQNIVLDPGIGFGKSVEHNLTLLRRLSEFQALGFPMLIGVSRKSFIGKILNSESDQRLEGSLIGGAIAALHGARILRVHDIAPTVRSLRMLEALLPHELNFGIGYAGKMENIKAYQ